MADIGRPTKYLPEYCEKIVEFFDIAPYTTTTETISGKNWEKEEIKHIPNLFPTFEKFAFNIGVHVETLINWTKEFPDFFEAYKKCKELQKNFLIQNGLTGLYPAAAFCFVAKNCTDMRDKQEVELSGSLDISQRLKDARERAKQR